MGHKRSFKILYVRSRNLQRNCSKYLSYCSIHKASINTVKWLSIQFPAMGSTSRTQCRTPTVVPNSDGGIMFCLRLTWKNQLSPINKDNNLVSFPILYIIAVGPIQDIDCFAKLLPLYPCYLLSLWSLYLYFPLHAGSRLMHGEPCYCYCRNGWCMAAKLGGIDGVYLWIRQVSKLIVLLYREIIQRLTNTSRLLP